mgnify:CR=1 FL=1
MLKHKSSIIITALIAFVIALALIVATMYSYFANVQRQQLRTETEMASLAVIIESLGFRPMDRFFMIAKKPLMSWKIIWLGRR